MAIERMIVSVACVAVALVGCGGSGASQDGGSSPADGSADGDLDASMGNHDATLAGDDARVPGDAGSGAMDSQESASDSSVDAPAGDAAMTGACVSVVGEGGACNSLTGTVALMTTCTPGAQPAALGGTIENGTYVTDRVTHYDCDSGSSSTNGTTWSICSNRWDAPGTTYTASYQGNTVTLTETCPAAILGPQTFGYTATPGHLAFVQSGVTVDHVKQ